VKCQRLRDRLIIESQEKVTAWITPRWSGLTREVPIKLLAKGSGSDPAIFDLLLAEEANSIGKLVVSIENVFSGPFTATHEQGRRSMLYLAGPTLHLSIYGAMQINIPESKSSEQKSC
jgi:predicted SpoU family rRNA methylase